MIDIFASTTSIFHSGGFHDKNKQENRVHGGFARGLCFRLVGSRLCLKQQQRQFRVYQPVRQDQAVPRIALSRVTHGQYRQTKSGVFHFAFFLTTA
jgi:hypothetical protein